MNYSMSKIKTFILLLIISSFITISVNSQSYGKIREKHYYGDNQVALPLDGGLLSVIGIVGVGFFIAKRKRRI